MRQELSLNGFWGFTTDVQETGKTKKWFEKAPKDVDSHHVPGCWNLQDPKYFSYEGVGWYFKDFRISEELKDKKIDLIFQRSLA